ncbi:MAG: metallophosphoesterase family protein [Candidatus Thorarchaeota archaeon]
MHQNKFGVLLLLILISPIPVSFIGNTTHEIAKEPATIPASGTSPFDRGPMVGLVTNESAVIFWRTDGITNATLRYGLNDSVLSSIVNTTLDADHYFNLIGLDIDTKYYYQAISNGTESPIYHFLTAPPDGEEFKMIIVGDNRPRTTVTQPEEWETIAQMIADEEPHIVISTGDYVRDVEENDADNLIAWNYFTEINDLIGHYAPIFAAIGNHDKARGGGPLQLNYFFDAFILPDEPSPYYSFDYAGVHFSTLMTYELGLELRVTGDQLTWLENDLATTNKAVKFVVAHAPLYPVVHIDDSLNIYPEERDALQALFEEENVSLFMAGHDHLFDRLTVNGVTQVISGGGGAPLYDHPFWGGGYYHYTRSFVSSGHINISSVGIDGEIVETYEIPYDGPIEIRHRIHPSGSTKPVGTMPVIYFSEVPAEKYFSWDSGENQTELTGIPNADGNHTLDVYARNGESVWSHETFFWIATGATPTPPPGGPIDPLLIVGVVGVAGVVVVVVLVWFRKR